MKAKPFFKEAMGLKYNKLGSWRVRVTDFRRPSALRVADNILHALYESNRHHGWQLIEELAESADMTATIRGGKVKCDWKKEATK